MQNTQSTGPNKAARRSPATIKPYVLLERPSNAPHDARMHARMLPHDVRMHARMFPRILPTCCRARRPDNDPEIEAFVHHASTRILNQTTTMLHELQPRKTIGSNCSSCFVPL